MLVQATAYIKGQQCRKGHPTQHTAMQCRGHTCAPSTHITSSSSSLPASQLLPARRPSAPCCTSEVPFLARDGFALMLAASSHSEATSEALAKASAATPQISSTKSPACIAYQVPTSLCVTHFPSAIKETPPCPHIHTVVVCIAHHFVQLSEMYAFAFATPRVPWLVALQSCIDTSARSPSAAVISTGCIPVDMCVWLS